jgi:SAM-dependent methyltransferase
MSDQADVYGALLEDAVNGKGPREIVERDDGFIMTFDAGYLLEPFSKWSDSNERHAMRFVRGRVLDIGCGGGRVCLHLQERGLDVVGIDTSPGAVAVCNQRGVRDARVLSMESLDPSLGLFDTIVMLGQNFGMVGSRAGARRFLRRFGRISSPRGRIVGECFDPHGPRDAAQRRYLERNVSRGRMPGQLRVRVRYRELSTPWHDWLQVSKDELKDVLDGTGWRLARTLGDGPSYVAIIDKTRST